MDDIYLLYYFLYYENKINFSDNDNYNYNLLDETISEYKKRIFYTLLEKTIKNKNNN